MKNFLGNVTFSEYCTALLGQYNNNLKNIIYDSTEMFLKLTKNPTHEFKKTKDISNGKFYLIRYSYNGLPIWCPIFVIDQRYNSDTRKRIIYSINIDYLEYKYKILFFDLLYYKQSEIVNKNIKLNDNEIKSIDESPFFVNFEYMYKLLKNNGEKHYSITAYDFNKIYGLNNGDPNIYCVSTVIIPRFIFLDPKIINSKVIQNMIIKENDIIKRRKLLELIEEMDNILKEYENDIDEYYKRIKLLENKYKNISIIDI